MKLRLTYAGCLLRNSELQNWYAGIIALCSSSNSLTSSAGDQGGGAACCACCGIIADSNAASAVVDKPPSDDVDIDSEIEMWSELKSH